MSELRQDDEMAQIGRQVASAYRAGLADARAQVMSWADEEMQSLPEFRTPVAHGKAELLSDLRGFVAARAEQTAGDPVTPPTPPTPSPDDLPCVAGEGGGGL